MKVYRTWNEYAENYKDADADLLMKCIRRLGMDQNEWRFSEGTLFVRFVEGDFTQEQMFVLWGIIFASGIEERDGEILVSSSAHLHGCKDEFQLVFPNGKGFGFHFREKQLGKLIYDRWIKYVLENNPAKI